MAKICLCRGISKETIEKAVKKGAKSFSEIKIATGVGTGGCHGARCQCEIE